MCIAQELLNNINSPDFLKRVITGDETRVYGYDVGTRKNPDLRRLRSTGKTNTKNDISEVLLKLEEDRISKGDYFEINKILLNK